MNARVRRTKSAILATLFLPCASLVFSTDLAFAQYALQGKLIGTGASRDFRQPGQRCRPVRRWQHAHRRRQGRRPDPERHGFSRKARVSGASKAANSSAPTPLATAFRVRRSRYLPTATPRSLAAPADNTRSRSGLGLYPEQRRLDSKQGGKLIGSGARGAAAQGTTVALSGDGNTAVVGAVLRITGKGVLPGSSRATVVCGRKTAPSWLATAQSEKLCSVLSRYRPTARR